VGKKKKERVGREKTKKGKEERDKKKSWRKKTGGFSGKKKNFHTCLKSRSRNSQLGGWGNGSVGTTGNVVALRKKKRGVVQVSQRSRHPAQNKTTQRRGWEGSPNKGKKKKNVKKAQLQQNWQRGEQTRRGEEEETVWWERWVEKPGAAGSRRTSYRRTFARKVTNRGGVEGQDKGFLGRQRGSTGLSEAEIQGGNKEKRSRARPDNKSLKTTASFENKNGKLRKNPEKI